MSMRRLDLEKAIPVIPDPQVSSSPDLRSAQRPVALPATGVLQAKGRMNETRLSVYRPSMMRTSYALWGSLVDLFHHGPTRMGTH